MKTLSQIVIEATEVVNLSKVRDEKKLTSFHKDLMGSIADRAKEMYVKGNEYHESGKLPLDVGTRFTTEHGRKNKQAPWTVTGHYVDHKDPNRFGYHIERGAGETKEKSMHMVGDPRLEKIHGPSKWKDIQNGVQVFKPLQSVK